ncbi:MAG: G3E family GTPase [Cognaticolwellia sp.]|jgi:G3E family GTPase
MNNQRTPVTIITGFLGAGKTTLLNQIIAQKNDTRFAIIENEIGAVNLDSEFIIGADEDIFQITDGCLCCSLSVELSKLLGELIRRKSEFNHLIIETTGIADPSGIASVFVSDLNVQQHFELDGILCLVDSFHIDELLKSKETEAARQISFADVLVFNKSDLVDAKTLKKLQQTIKNINPFAKQLTTNYSKIEVNEILNIQAFEPKRVEVKMQNVNFSLAHRHGNITSQTYQYFEAFDILKFRQFVQVLMHFQSMRIYRMKGILNIEGQTNKIIFQSVQQQFVFTKGSEWQPNENRQTTLVVIGNGLSKMAFDKKLRQCFA